MYAATVAAHASGHRPNVGGRASAGPRRGRPESVLAPIAVFAAVAALLIAIAAVPTFADATTKVATRRVRVGASDTLWSIARANPVAGLTTSRSVAAIRSLNHMGPSATIQPGMVISVPADETYTSNLAMR